MPEEKTEKATPKKRRDARKEGNVLKSNEINSWLTISAGIFAFILTWENIIDNLKTFFITIISDRQNIITTFNPETIRELLLLIGQVIIKVCAPIMLIVMASGLLANLVQSGFLFVPNAIKPKAERISIISGFKRIFGSNSKKELVKVILKLSATLSIAYTTIKQLFNRVFITINMDIEASAGYTINLFARVVSKILIAMASIAIIDYIFQWFSFEKQLKMTKQEVKDEYKTTEGNPEIKSKIKEIQQTMATSRMMQEIPGSDVVITNPTHYAVVLKYDSTKDEAPKVTAKGVDKVAQRIKETARKNGVEIVENKEIAQVLYKTTDIGNEIPTELFNAVAEILAYIYSLKNKN